MNPRSLIHPRLRPLLKQGAQYVLPSRMLDSLLPNSSQSAHRLAFVFQGHGGTWPKMGLRLYKEEASFRETIQRCSLETQKLIGLGITDYFEGKQPFAPEGSKEQLRLNSLIDTAFELALSNYWKSKGLVPDAVIGVCRGEIAAAYVADAFSLEDGMALAHSMAVFTGTKKSEGFTLTISTSFEKAQRLSLYSSAHFDAIAELSPLVSILYCTEENLSGVQRFLSEYGLMFKAAPCNYPSHIFFSADLSAMRDKLFQVKARPLTCPLYSSLSGDVIPTGTTLQPDHWYETILYPVLFSHSICAALTDNYDILLNVCANMPLESGIRSAITAMEKQVLVLDSVHKSKPELDTWNQTFGVLAKNGVVKTRRQPKKDSGNLLSSYPNSLAERIHTSHPDIIRNPYPYYHVLRQYGSVHYVESKNCWLVLDYKDVSEAMKRPEVFSSIRPEAIQLDKVLLDADAPSHTRVRRILTPYFSASNVQNLENYTRQTAEELLLKGSENPEFDMVDEFAIPLAELVTSQFLGLAYDESTSLRETLLLNKYKIHENIPVSEERARQLVERVQKSPGNDLCSQLLQASGDDSLTSEEVVSLMKLFFLAAPVTTSALIALATLHLLRCPSIRKELQADLSLIPAFIEETLRLDTPEPTTTRVTLEDVEIAGSIIPKGSTVRLYFGAANRDPKQFENPDSFRLRHNSKTHLSFGTGPHYCIGAFITRLEARVALEVLLTTWPDFSAARPISTVSYVHSGHTHALRNLFIRAK